jgi:CRISPR-associated protein (TIGR02584 family)
MLPSDFPRRIFVAVTGLSPQIVTESLYAMAIGPACAEERFVPTEIHLITTEKGAEHARLNLLSRSPGHFHRLCVDYPQYQLQDIDFSEENIHVIADAEGKALNDIRNSRENDIAADFITSLIRSFTRDDRSAVHISIAGGRKTMGYYLGYALSLYGREQDRLSHVLVSSPYENHKDFYYPTPQESVIHVDEKGTQLAYDCRNAVIDLAGIPFVRLRQGLPEKLLTGDESFTEVVAQAQMSLPSESVYINLRNQTLELSGQVVKLAPALLIFYAMLALNKKAGGEGIHWTQEHLAGDYLRLYAKVWGEHSGYYVKAERGMREGMGQSFIEQKKSKLNSLLLEALGARMGRLYQIYQQEKIAGTAYRRIGIDTDPANIKVEF